MSDRSNPEPRPAGADEVERDLRSLHAMTGERLASLDTHVHAARDRAERERHFMTGFRWVRWTAAAAAAVALALLLIPVSYNKTTGQDVAFTFSAPGLSGQDVNALAGKFKDAIAADAVKLTAEQGDQGVTYTLSGFVAKDSHRNASAITKAFADVLNSKGYIASASVTPHVERVSGSVYAMAMNQVIRIETDGKTASQIESEIREQLEAAGVSNPEVTVTDADGKREVKILAKAESHDPSQPLPEVQEPTIMLTKGGQEISDANACQVKVKKIKNETGALQLTVDVTYKGQTSQAVIDNADQMSDAALASAVESQLRAAGLDLKVTMKDGQIEVTGNDQ
jgi:hypothetical protein